MAISEETSDPEQIPPRRRRQAWTIMFGLLAILVVFEGIASMRLAGSIDVAANELRHKYGASELKPYFRTASPLALAFRPKDEDIFDDQRRIVAYELLRGRLPPMTEIRRRYDSGHWDRVLLLSVVALGLSEGVYPEDKVVLFIGQSAPPGAGLDHPTSLRIMLRTNRELSPAVKDAVERALAVTP